MDDAKPANREPELPADFEQELGRQILQSEKLRALIVAASGAIMMVFVSIAAVAARAQGSTYRSWMWSLVIAGGAVVYELGTRFIFDYFLKRDRQPPLIGRCANAAVETSIPTLLMAVMANTVGPEVAISSAAPFAYFFFIILSALRLDFRLSAFTGFVAAAGYAGVTMSHVDAWRARLGHVCGLSDGIRPHKRLER